MKMVMKLNMTVSEEIDSKRKYSQLDLDSMMENEVHENGNGTLVQSTRQRAKVNQLAHYNIKYFFVDYFSQIALLK